MILRVLGPVVAFAAFASCGLGQARSPGAQGRPEPRSERPAERQGGRQAQPTDSRRRGPDDERPEARGSEQENDRANAGREEAATAERTRRFLQQHPDVKQALMAKADANGDGTLDESEHRAMRGLVQARMAEMHGQAGDRADARREPRAPRPDAADVDPAVGRPPRAERRAAEESGQAGAGEASGDERADARARQVGRGSAVGEPRGRRTGQVRAEREAPHDAGPIDRPVQAPSPSERGAAGRPPVGGPARPKSR